MKSIQARILICSLAAATLLAGCSSGGTASSESASSQSSAASSASASGKITDTDVTLTLVRSDNANQPMQTDSLVIQEIYKRTGVKLSINAIPSADWDTKTKVMLATDDMPDIMFDTPNAANYVSSGIFVAISDKFSEMPNLSKLLAADTNSKKCYVDGKLYYAPELGRNWLALARVPMIRQDLLTSLNLTTPTTYDELYNDLLAIKTAYPDVYPIANRNGTTNLFTCFGYSLGSGGDIDGTGTPIYYDYDVDGGKWQFAPIHENFTTMLSFFNKLYSAGLLDPDYATCTSAQWKEKLSSGKSVFFFDNPTFAFNFNSSLKTAVSADAKFVPFEIPANSTGKARGYWYSASNYSATTISSKSANIDVACKLVDWLYSDEGADLTNYGVEGEQYTKSGSTYTIKSEIVQQFASTSDPWRSFLGSIGAGELGLARYYDSASQSSFMSSEESTMYASWGKFHNLVDYVAAPAFTSDENDELKTLTTKVNTILASEYDKYIMGKESISNWTKVQQSIMTDAQRIEDLYNTAEQRSK